MFFIGYISSLIVAVMLSVFYIGNVTRCIATCIKEKSVVANEIRVANESHKTPPYFTFETTSKFTTKVVIITNLSAKNINFSPTHILQEYHYYSECKPPLGVYGFTIFSRPPPYYVS